MEFAPANRYFEEFPLYTQRCNQALENFHFLFGCEIKIITFVRTSGNTAWSTAIALPKECTFKSLLHDDINKYILDKAEIETGRNPYTTREQAVCLLLWQTEMKVGEILKPAPSGSGKLLVDLEAIPAECRIDETTDEPETPEPARETIVVGKPLDEPNVGYAPSETVFTPGTSVVSDADTITPLAELPDDDYHRILQQGGDLKCGLHTIGETVNKLQQLHKWEETIERQAKIIAENERAMKEKDERIAALEKALEKVEWEVETNAALERLFKARIDARSEARHRAGSDGT